jgi:A/G-specific adenine glycosylase
MTTEQVINRCFADRLLAWWDEHGRKDLPWQHPRSPYRVWISEIMLQQTQVATVIPYFERWMRRFPDISSLAAAPLDDVLAQWSGLGYYARARNLHKTAIRCVEKYDGDLPADAEALNDLPGIGQSTANAIVSQSSDLPAAVLDGNVRRILARHAAIEGWTGKPAVQKQLWKEAQERLPASRGADYSQAIMDLGALLCTRSSPACGDCPVSADCQALRRDEIARYPSARPKTQIRERKIHMMILQDDDKRVLLEKRPPAGIWGGLWSLPEGNSIADIEARLGISCRNTKPLPELEHRLTHLKMTIKPALLAAKESRQVKCSPEQVWFELPQQADLGLPKPVSDLLEKLRNGEYE